MASSFLYLWTGAVSTADPVSLNAMAYASDVAPLCCAVVERCLATQRTNTPYSTVTQTVWRVHWRNSEKRYATTSISGYGQPGAVTNTTLHYYLYGRQAQQSVVRPNEPYGFQTNINLSCFGVSPLLWGDQLYTSASLAGTVPGTVGMWTEAGRYVYSTETNAWPFLGPTGEWIYLEFDLAGNPANVPPYQYTVLTNSRVLLDYDPLNQRPNSLTPWITRAQMEAIDVKLTNLFQVYLAPTNYDEHFSFQQGSNYVWVTAPWFGDEKIVQTQRNENYPISTNVPDAEVLSVVTNVLGGVATNYDDLTVVTNDVEGSPEDFSYIVTNTYQVWGWEWVQYSGEATSGTGAPDRVSYVTNLSLTSGVFGTSNNWNDANYTTTNWTESTYLTNVYGDKISGTGSAGEIDGYYFPEVPATATNYNRRVFVAKVPGTALSNDSIVVTNWTNPGTAENYNRMEAVVGEGSQYTVKRTYIWAGVSNILADYMAPWIEDSKTTAANEYLYNIGWDPNYATGWRLWRAETNAIPPEDWQYTYWLDYSETSYWITVYDYYRTDTNDFSAPWHYRRTYTSYFLWDIVSVDTSQFWNVTWSNWQYTVVGSEEDYTYRKREPQTNYWVYSYTTNYGLDVDRYYQIVFPAYPNTTPSAFGSLTNFAATFPDLFSGTNQWLYRPQTTTQTNVLLSSSPHSFIDTNGVSFAWTSYAWTTYDVVNPPVYSNAWDWPLRREALNQRSRAVTNLTDLLASNVVFEARRRSFTTNDYGNRDVGWAKAAISTGTWTYAVSISRQDNFRNFTFSKTQVRAIRKPGMVIDGDIDVYLRFGRNAYNEPLGSRYDLEALGFPMDYYVRVPALCIPDGVSTSQWLGNLDVAPAFPNLETEALRWPHYWTIQNGAAAPICIFKPEFSDTDW